jgi:molybdenum cofactor guanylyltransferase
MSPCDEVTAQIHFSAVILAGGKSQRMGRDKAWLRHEGGPLICRQIALARELGAAEVFISGRAEVDYTTLQCPVLTDQFLDAGPLGGIERALATAGTSLVLALAVDLPAMRLAVLQQILNHCFSNTGAIPRINSRIEPLAGFYPTSAHSLAATLLTGKRNAVQGFAQQCVESSQAVFVDLPPGAATAFANWNTPADAGIS